MTPQCRQGQATMETALLMPLFLPLVFALIQIGHLGLGLAIVSYSASSVAHQAVAQDGFNQSDAEQKFKSLLVAGMQFVEINGKSSADGGDETKNIRVTACAELPAYPLVGPFLQKALRTGTAPTPGGCSGATKWLGPVGLMGPPYHFIVQGQAMARMNYNVGK